MLLDYWPTSNPLRSCQSGGTQKSPHVVFSVSNGVRQGGVLSPVLPIRRQIAAGFKRPGNRLLLGQELYLHMHMQII